MAYYQKAKATISAFSIIILLVIIAGIIGWISNIINVVEAISNPVTGLFIMQCAGIVVAPLGSVLGYVLW